MKSITITAHDDGTYAVTEAQADSIEPSDLPDLGDMDEEGFDDFEADAIEGERYESMDEALDIVREMLDSDLYDGKPMIEGEREFVAGFKRARGV